MSGGKVKGKRVKGAQISTEYRNVLMSAEFFFLIKAGGTSQKVMNKKSISAIACCCSSA